MILVDTNVLVRLADPTDPAHQVATDVLAKLRLSGETLLVAPQILAEFWSVATRPRSVNGLGLDFGSARAELERLEQLFGLLAETYAVYEEWKRLIFAHQVMGRLVFDARLVATMAVFGIKRILTFNAKAFAPYGVEIIDPTTSVPPPPP